MREGSLRAATVDAIRDRSGVSKTTIYKHWPNRLCVAIDTFADRLALDTTLPEEGTSKEDLTRQIRTVSAFYASPLGSTFAGRLAHDQQDPHAQSRLEARLTSSRQHRIDVLWQRAVERREARQGITADLALDILFGPVVWRLLTGRPPLINMEIEVLVASVLV